MAIVEERCYALHSQFGPNDYFEAYRTLGQKVQTETLGGLIGYFSSEVGELNVIVSLWRYDSFEDRHRRRAQLAADPQWQAYLQQVRPMIRSMENRLLTPVIFA
jgi:hypothetical protein